MPSLPEPLYHLTPISDNVKTGKCAVTTSSRDLCPGTCPLKAGGCYANSGPLALHWAKVTVGQRGTSWERHMWDLAALPPKRKIRLNQAGDLPEAEKIMELGYTLKNRVAWTYTHHRDGPRLAAAREVNKMHHGLVINVSANNPEDADKIKGLGSPVAVMIPHTTKALSSTPGGLKIVACPEQTGKVKSCDECGNGLPLCARIRSYAIGFYPHGSQIAKAAAIAAKETQ